MADEELGIADDGGDVDRVRAVIQDMAALAVVADADVLVQEP